MKSQESTYEGVVIRGTPHQIVAKYEAKADNAQSRGDHHTAQIYLQYAEHWRKQTGDQKNDKR